jgi:hypothetical protein
MEEDGSNMVDIAVEGLVSEFPDIAEHVLAIKSWYESEEGKRQVSAFMTQRGQDDVLDTHGGYGKAAQQCVLFSVLALVPAVFFAAMATKHSESK